MIKLKGVSKRYASEQETIHSLRDVNLSIKHPGIYLLQGPSGSGKSTLLSIIGAMLRPTEGSVEVLGKQVAKLPEQHASVFRRKHLGFVFQAYHLLPDLPALENVMLPLIPEHPSREEAVEKATKALAWFGLENRITTPARLLSGGEKQRVAIARAIAHEPKLVLADEPTANLDRENKQLFLTEMELLKSTGLTLLIATHDPLFAEWEAVDGLFLMKDGRIL